MDTPYVACHQKKALTTNASLVFIDESGFLMAPLVRRTWAPIGNTPVFRQRGRAHHKVSAIAAIVASPRQRQVNLYFRCHVDTSIYARLVKTFLVHLSKQIRGRFIIIWDRLNTHRARVITQWLLKTHRVTMEFLPPYAPELNPVEYVWGHVKTGPMANLAKMDVEDLAQATYHHTRNVQKNSTLLKSFLKHSSLF